MRIQTSLALNARHPAFVLLLLAAACGSAGTKSEAGEEPPSSPASAAERVQPSDLAYLGAFRLPGPSGGSNWEYSGYAMTWRSDGDADGPSDGFPGSLFAIGHDHHQQVSEISIPVPVRAASKDVEGLPTAATLQPFHDVTAGGFGELEIPRAGLAYLPPATGGAPGTLHFCWGQHLQFEHDPSHGYCSPDLAAPAPRGPWILQGFPNHVTNDFLFEIPKVWADTHVDGAQLATGRFRDGLWSGRGPALLAYTPPSPDAPPDVGATIAGLRPLLLYGTAVAGSPALTTAEDHAMNGFKEADEWSGGAWLEAEERAAVVLVGTKATGRCWYGYSNGVAHSTDPDATEFPDVPAWPHDARGWWSEGVQAQALFFDPADLAAVAVCAKETWAPQPYATLDLTPYLYDPGFDYERGKRFLTGAVAYDRARGNLYVVERRADEDKSLVHVFRVGP